MKASSYFRSRVADVNSDECAAGYAAVNNDIEPRKHTIIKAHIEP